MDFDAVWQRSFGRINMAIREDNYQLFLDLLTQSDVSVNSPDNRGFLPIHLACLNSNPYQYLIELLNFNVVDVNSVTYDGCTPLILICKNEFFSRQHLLDSTKLLVERGADVNSANNDLEFPLLLSVERGMYEILIYLCSRPKIEINKRNICGRTAIDETLSSEQDGTCFELLLSLGATIDDMSTDMQSDRTCLSIAINFKNFRAVERLVEVANEKGIENYVNIRLKDGTSPLMIACQKKFVSCIRFLLDNGADVNAITIDQVAVVHFVTEFCDLEVFDLIVPKFDFSALSNFENINDTRIIHMKNPLHLAICSSNENIMRYLIDHCIYSPNSLQIFRQDSQVIHGVLHNQDTFYSALSFALSVGARRTLIDYLIQSGGSLDLYSEIILPPALCEKDHYRILNHLIKIGFDINRYARLSCKHYVSNLSLVAYNPKLLKKLLKYGLDVDDLFRHFLFVNFDQTHQLLETFALIPRTKNVRQFWNQLRLRIQAIYPDDENVSKIDKLFETPTSLTQISKHQFKKTIWQIHQNTAKFYEHTKIYPSTIVD